MFKLTIDTESAAFEQCGEEVARILRQAALSVKYWSQKDTTRKALFDYNGNKVGEMELTP